MIGVFPKSFPPEFLAKQLAFMLARSAFETLDEAMSSIRLREWPCVSIQVSKDGVTMEAHIPREDLMMSLDSLVERYLKPQADAFLMEVWRQ
ncbi:MAG: hypothetical protein ACT4O5_15745 [Gammaproteobacteria bacterium]